MGNSSEYFFDTFTKVRTCGRGHHTGRMSRVGGGANWALDPGEVILESQNLKF